MTGTHSLGDWEKKFDLLFTFRFQDGAENAEMIGKAKNVRDFIREALLAQKEGFRREIEKRIRPDYMVGNAPGDNAVGSEQRAFGANSVLIALLTKLDTNGI